MSIFTKSLLFVAVVFIGYYIITTVFKFVLENQYSKGKDVSFPYKKFISQLDLLKMRMTVAILVFGILFSILISILPEYVYIFVVVATILAGVSYFLPLWYYKIKLDERNTTFQSSLLDFTMGLASGMKSGQSLSQAMESISHRLQGPIVEEITTVLREHRLGLDMSEALERLYQRMPCEDLHLLVTSIKLTTKSGGSLVDVLEKMVVMIRQRTEFQEKLKTMTAQGKFEAVAISLTPLGAFILLYIVDPELMRPLLTTVIGWTAIGIVILLVSLGFYVIKKIITIEV